MCSGTGLSPRVLVVGYNAFDVIVPVTEHPLPDEKLEVRRMIACGGGPGATAAVALARLGASVKFLTPLADDPPGIQQKAELLAAGVDLSSCPVLPGHRSPRAVILVDQARAQRTIYWTRGNLPHLSVSQVLPEMLDQVDLLYLDGHEPAVSLFLARQAGELGLPVVMDAGSVRAESAELVRCCTDVVGSRNFGPDLTGCPDPVAALRAMRAMGPSLVAMTFGSEGVIGLEGEETLLVPSFKVPVLDTTGAGDAFHAGYAFARASGMGFSDCLDWGSAVAGLKCRDWGGRLGLPQRAEVEDLLASGIRVPVEPLADRLAPEEC